MQWIYHLGQYCLNKRRTTTTTKEDRWWGDVRGFPYFGLRFVGWVELSSRDPRFRSRKSPHHTLTLPFVIDGPSTQSATPSVLDPCANQPLGWKSTVWLLLSTRFAGIMLLVRKSCFVGIVVVVGRYSWLELRQARKAAHFPLADLIAPRQ